MLTNLVSNAIKFTPDDGRLGVTLAVEGEHAVLRVSDSGIGISDDDRERLFERFFRAGNALERAIPGRASASRSARASSMPTTAASRWTRPLAGARR